MSLTTIKTRFHNYVSQTIEEGDDKELRRIKTALVIVPSILIPLTIFMGAILLAAGLTLQAFIPWSYAAVTSFCLARYLRTKRLRIMQNTQLILIMLLPSVLMWLMGGFDGGGVMLLWSLFPPVAALILFNEKTALRWFIGYLALVIISALIDSKVAGFNQDFPEWAKSLFYMINILFVSTGLFVLVSHTISEERRSYLALNKDRDQLERLSAELQIAKNEADASNRAKSDFLASMSHEIRTPMNAILGLTEITLRTELNAKQQDNLTKIYISANTLLRIINDILDVSKIEAGKMTIESVPINLEQVFDDLATVMATDIEAKNLELLFKVDPKVPVHLIGDGLRLGQVLLNLTGNAKKFTDEGDIVVSVDLLDITDNRASLIFSVQDTGIGMTQDQMRKLFNPFVQADSSTSRKYGGTGLGLTICKQLVELMNGYIWVTSEVGRGSCFQFTVILPLDPQEGAEYEEKVYNTSRLGNLRILVADDNENARTIFSQHLEAFGFAVDVADSGQAAIDAIVSADREVPYHVAIIDYRMPGMNGLETATLIKQETQLNHAPKLILVSAASRSVEDETEEKLAVLDEMLSKPVNPSMLLDAISNVMSSNVSAPKLRKTRLEEFEAEHLKPIRGARILLAEDNEFNQDIALEFLKLGDFQVDVAMDGKTCVDMVEMADYECILMDIHMPEMDGYTATRIIKSKEKHKDLPIIAMTANVMAEDKQRALDSGMVDHIGKPVVRAALYEALLKWIPHGERQVEERVLELPVEADVTLPTRLRGCNLSKAMINVSGNRKLLNKLLLNVYRDQFDDARKLRDAIETGELTYATTLSHTLKSVFGTLGHTNLQRALGEIERRLKAGEDDFEELLGPLAVDYGNFMTDLAAWAAEQQPQESETVTDKTLDPEKAREAYQALCTKLENFDPSASDTLEILLTYTEKTDALESVAKLVDSFDFFAALEQLRKIELE